VGRPTGSADLPLHGGQVPAWLALRMARLGRVIAEAIVLEYGRDELLRRLSHPFWFQSFGAVMGMDWHSSGITTSVLGALRRGLSPAADELGLWICGGRGKASRRTPAELIAVGERTGLDGHALARTSRLVAKVDSAAVQDGFALYLHGFVVARDGQWTVVQQGMRPATGMARRYHWLAESVTDFVDAPHAAIEGAPAEAPILDVTNHDAAPSRAAQVELVSRGPDAIVGELTAFRHLTMPRHHDVRPTDVFLRRLHGTLRAAADVGPRAYADLLLVPGVGARTVEALALVAEVVHGAPCRFRDPARFSYAHGGKDGHPFPVPLRVYDQTIRVLRDAVGRAKLGNDDRLAGLRELDRQARALEGPGGPSLDELFARERRLAGRHGGRTVFDDRRDAIGHGVRPERADRDHRAADAAPQLRLPGL
jgi:hypothetical protein